MSLKTINTKKICFLQLLRRLLRFKILFVIIVISNCSEKNPHLFTNGISPIEWSENIESSKDCKKCHLEIYLEWETSRHKVSFTNELYKESHAKEPLTWCVNCHLPLMKSNGNPDSIKDRLGTEEGISCIVCHKRNNKILTAHIPSNPKEHDYIEVKEMKHSEFCKNCHQFNFPTGTGNVPREQFKYSSQPMQNTFTEWQMSYFFQKENCQDCHMEYKNTHRTHKFPGGHNKELLAKSFNLTILKLSKSEVKLILSAFRLGHAFPTGDLFRKLVIRLLDKKGNEIRKIELGYQYSEIPENKNSQTSSGKRLIERNIITPPVANEIAIYYKVIPMNSNEINTLDSYQLELSYINQSNHLFSTVNESNSKLIFKEEKIKNISNLK